MRSDSLRSKSSSLGMRKKFPSLAVASLTVPHHVEDKGAFVLQPAHLRSSRMKEQPQKPRIPIASTCILATLLAAAILAAASARAQTITTFNASGAGTAATQGTVPTAINTAGTIAGYYNDSDNVHHGFVRATRGIIT